jgi:signal peptidase I
MDLLTLLMVVATVAGLILASGVVILLWPRGDESRRRRRLAGFVLGVGAALVLGTLLTLRISLVGFYITPTGSMAPTVMGARVRTACGNCGCGIDAGVPMDSRTGEIEVDLLAAVDCPSCGAAVPCSLDALVDGDSIGVLRALPLSRWDVVAFRSIQNPNGILVFRLVGLPGETIELVNGDVFVDGERSIKSPRTAATMWIPLHDSAHLPSSPLGSHPGWKPEAGDASWRRDGAGWRFEDRAGREARLVFENPLLGHLSYNDLRPRRDNAGFEAVRDVRVEVDLYKFSGGALVFEWRSGAEAVDAVVKPDGTVELRAAGRSIEGKTGGAIADGTRIAFSFRDGEAQLSAGAGEVARLQVSPMGIEAFKALGAKNPPCRLAIAGRGCRLSISSLRVFRDVHYVDVPSFAGRDSKVGSGCRDRAVVLGEGEFYVLGDNSESAFDSRW